MKDNRFLTMAFESSCDETAVAVLADGREVLSNVISSQIDIFKNYGGVVPEIAARHHLENVNYVMEQALNVGALLIGVATAKAVSFAAGIPIVGVHHIMGHIAANYIQFPELEPPFTALIASGGHTNIAEVTGYNSCRILGSTRDDAIGEAYDKVARVLGLGYPGGPKIDKIAAEGNPEAIHFKRVFLEKDSYDFSFSGLKTAVLNHINSARQKGEEINRADVAASFQQAVIDVVCQKAVDAAVKGGHGKLVLAGGVASNSKLRQELKLRCERENIGLYIPPASLCTDNGAMIGCAAYYKYKEGKTGDWHMDAHANLPFE